MANRVRFLSLVLAGFGRYDRPTRFNLAGRSCTFTSANELGKSTLQAGLLATLFGPPAVRAKAAAFQSRHRSWHGPIAFFGELDLTVNDEPWRIRQDFELLDTKVWRLSSSAPGELRLHAKAKSPRSGGDSEPYARLLQDWLGMAEISFYEAMFTISQESTLSTSWQVDPRIAALVYGPVVERLGKTLHELLGRFRDITRNTREYQITVGSQGERNGRSDGRLDEVVARIDELQSNLRTAQERAATVAAYRVRLQELSIRAEQLRSDAAETSKSLEAWQDWIDLESRLKPAVQSYERLHELNERCQQITRPLAEIRARTMTEMSIFDHAPRDLADRLEYYPLLVQGAREAKERHAAVIEAREQLNATLAALQQSYESEFCDIRGRAELADQVEELRLVREEIASTKNQLEELTRSDESPDDQRAEWRRRLAELDPWRELADTNEHRLQQIRSWIDSFCRHQVDFEVTRETVRSETQWIAEQDAAVARLDMERRELARSRQLDEESLAATATAARTAAERANEAHQRLAQGRDNLDRRYVDFAGAPASLLDLWDRLRELEVSRSLEQQNIENACMCLRNLDQRVLWRRGLSVGGSVVAALCILFDRRWSGWLGAMFALSLIVSLRWIYRVHGAQAAEQRRIRQRHEAELLRLGKRRDEIVAQLGAHFVVPAEREAEWRRLWPAYRRELQQLQSDERSLPAASQLTEWTQQAADTDIRLARSKEETAALLDDLDDALTRARAERVRRQLELDRLNEQLQSHIERYLQVPEPWEAEPLRLLPPAWGPVLQLAHAAAPQVRSVSELVAWCRSLDDNAWARFHEICREYRELDALLAPDPATVAAKENSIRQARDVLHSLHEHERRLIEAIAPFTADTDPAWLRERFNACVVRESAISERQRELGNLPEPERLAEHWHRSEQELSEAIEALAPLLQRFEQDPARIVAALAERTQLNEQARQLDGQAAVLLSESSFGSLEELAHEAGKAEGLVGTIRAESRQLVARVNELWQAVDAPPELAYERAVELESRVKEVQSTLDAVERERAELVATIRQLESDPATDVASIETELALLCDERTDLEKSRDSIAAEFQEANRLMQELERVERTALEGRITAYFADFSRTAGRRVELDEELRLTVRNEDGTRYAPDQLSHGARDQLYLAVYLASTAGFDLPFILDDPFVNCDSERLAAIRACWDRLIPDHQLILLSHNPEMAAWAPSLEMREAA